MEQPEGPLLTIGPFNGIDATTDPFYTDGAYAIDSLNLVPNHQYQALAPIAGRLATDAFLNAPPTSLAIFYPKLNPPQLMTCTSLGNFASLKFQAPNASWQQVNVPSWQGNSPTGNPGSFARHSGWLFFSNEDPNNLNYKFDSNLKATFWGIRNPPGPPQIAIGSPSNGQIYGNAYYYRYTYESSIATDPGLNQESTPSAPAGPFNIGTPLGPPTSTSASIAQTPAPGLAANTGGGTIPAGTYFIGTTWVTAAGEEGLSQVAQITIAGAPPNEIVVTPSSPPAGATGYNIYTGTSQQGMTLQGGTRSGTGASTEVNYTTTGSAPPAYTGALNPPATPVLSATSGGTIGARTEYYQLTYVNNNGETTASPEASINVLANHLVVVQSPAQNANATGYNVYASNTSAQEVLQNASPIAIGTNWTEPASGLILGQNATLTLQGSLDPQVVTINVYRIGGQSLGNWFFVGSVNNPANGGTTTFVDNTPDSGVTGQALVLARDVPAPFICIFPHVERMFGFGYHDYTGFNGNFHAGRPSDLWYSNYNEPWGFDNTNQVIPVGSQDAGDIAVNGSELGSTGILWKTKTTWALYGSTPSDLFVMKLFDVGCASKNSAIVALGVAFWLSNQGFYMYDGATLTYLSKPVKKILDGFSESDYAASAACFDDRMYWCAFPTQNIALGYDTVSNNWFKGSLTTSIFAFDTEGASRPTSPDLVFGARYNTVDQWFAATTDLGAPIVSTITSRLASSGPQIGTMRVRHLELVCSQNPSSNDQVMLSVIANPATTARTFTHTFGASAVNQRQRSSVAPGIQGDALQLQMTMITSDGTVVSGAAAHGWTRRLYTVT